MILTAAPSSSASAQRVCRNGYQDLMVQDMGGRVLERRSKTNLVSRSSQRSECQKQPIAFTDGIAIRNERSMSCMYFSKIRQLRQQRRDEKDAPRSWRRVGGQIPSSRLQQTHVTKTRSSGRTIMLSKYGGKNGPDCGCRTAEISYRCRGETPRDERGSPLTVQLPRAGRQSYSFKPLTSPHLVLHHVQD